MKALALLELIKMMGVSGDIEKTIDESILELRALENRSCNNCKKQETLMCPVTSFGGNIEDFSCNRWESKC